MVCFVYTTSCLCLQDWASVTGGTGRASGVHAKDLAARGASSRLGLTQQKCKRDEPNNINVSLLSELCINRSWQIRLIKQCVQQSQAGRFLKGS